MIGAGMDKHAQPGTGSYGISKMALRRLVRQMSVEFDTMPDGPVVSLFQPGLVDTPGIRSHIKKAGDLNLPHAEWLAGRLEAGECLTAEQAANMLASAMVDRPRRLAPPAGLLLDAARIVAPTSLLTTGRALQRRFAGSH